MAYDRLYKLYDALKEQNATSVDREAFHKQMSAPGFEGYQNRLQLYKELKANGYVDYPNYETFSAELGMHAAAPAKGAQKHQQRQQTTPAKPQSAKPQPTKPQQGWTAAQRKQAEAQLEQNAYDNARLSRQWQQQSQNAKRMQQRAKHIGTDFTGDFRAKAEARMAGIATPEPNMIGSSNNAAKATGVVIGDDGRAYNQYETDDGSLTTNVGDVIRANETRNLRERLNRHGLDPENVTDDDIMKMYADEAYDAALRADKTANQQAVDEDAGRTPLETMRRAVANYDDLDDEYSDVEREVKRAQRINPDAMVAETLRRMPPSVLSRLRRQYGLYYEQHPKELKRGQNAQQAAEEAIKGSIYQHVYNKLVAANAPKSTLEYLMRKIADQPLYSQHIANQTAAGAITGNHAQYLADEQAMSAYENEHPVTGFFGTVGNMAADPTMYIGGWVGSMASKAVARGIGRAVVKGASEKMAERLAGRTLAGRIAQGVAAGAGNLGFYEGSHAALRQDRTGEHSIGDVLAATGRGVLLGAATGVAAPLIGNVADKVVARTASTGGKLAVRTGETATSVLAEGTIFAAPELIENARLADGDPNKRSGWSIWAGSLGTMAGFKGKHLIESAPRVLAELRTDGARRGVGFEGRLRNMLDRTPADLQMTNADLQELRDRGYGGLADLYAQVRPPKLPSTPPEFRTTPPPLKDYAQYAQPEELGKNKDKDLDGYSAMQRLMDDHSVSAAVRAKAYYLLTGKMLPMPSVLSYDRTANDDGTITITALGAENPIPAYGSGPKSKMQEMGADVVVRKTFKSAKEADVYEAKVRRQIELNTVDVGEQLREAQVQDDALDAAIDAVYPEGNHELLKNQYWSGRVKSIKDAIDKYLESQLTANSPHNPHTIRRGIEEEYGVDIDKALKKEPNRRTQAEVEAVQEYANELYNFGGREETVENAQVGGSGQAGVPPAAGATSEEAAKSTTENAAEQAHEEGKKAWTDNDGADDDTALQGAVDEKAARAHAALDRLNELFDEEAVSVIKEDPNAMLSSPALSEEHRAAIQEYIEAMAGLDGVKEAAQKAAEQNQAEVENEVVKSTNKETKLLMPATMKDDSGKLVSIYVVDGKLVLNTSGGIDTQKSAQTIVVYDPNTGKYRFVDPHDILELGLPVSPDTAVQSAIDAIQQRHNGIFDHAEQAARQQKSLPAPTAEGGEGPKPPRGRKMVVKCLRELSEAKKPIDKLNAIARILYTVKYGSEGIITPEEQALVDKTLAELKEEGYEIVDKWEGQPYDEGMKLSSDTEFKLVEGENIWGVQDGETKIVGLNKPEVWNMKEETTQYRIGPNGERIPYKTKGRRLQSAAAIVVTRDDTGWSVTARRLEEVKGRLERLKKGQAPTKVIEHLEKDVAGLERQLAEEKKQAAARDKLKSLFTNEEITAIRKDPYAMLDSPGLSEEHRAAIREYIEAYNIKRKEPEGEASATGEGMTGSESTPAPEEKQPIQMGSGALGSIPKNEKGEPVYEQAEPSTAWQAILEQTEGDTDMAAGVVDSMIADKEAAVKKAKKAKPKHADTIAGKIAAEKERKAAIERAKAELEAWKKIAAAKAGHEKAVAERKAAEAKQQEAEQQTVQGQPTEPKQEEQPKADDEDAAERAIAVETDWNDKIDDYIVEHYPHIDGTRARTPEEQKLYDAEREALKNDKTYKEMIAARDAAIEKTEETKQQEQERHEAAVDQAEQPTKPEKADKPVKAEPTEAKEGKQSTEAEGEKPDGQNDGADSEMPEAGEGEDAGKNPSLGDVISTLYGKGKDFASRIFNMKFFDFAKTPDFMKRLGITGSKFTIRYGVIARHFGKDGSHDFTQSEWEQLPNAIGHPFAITRLADKEKGFRIYTTFKTEKGEYVVVGVDVKNAGRDVEVNAISTLFGRRNGAHLSENEQVVYRSEIITPEQESLLSRPNSDQYPPERESSEGKDNASGADTQEGGGKSAVAVKEKPEEKPKKDDDDDGPDGPTAGGAATGGKGKPESDSESEEVKKLRKEYDEACDHLEDVMTEWDDKIIDYIAEHYPTQATVSAETRSPKGIKEREAMDNDPVLKKMREERNAAVKKADEERYKAFKRMDAAETGKGEQEPASPSAAAEQKKPAERKIEDVGEHIAGARKDALAELSQSVADVTLESLIELPASKAFKRPDLKRAVKEGVLREEDARFAEAVMAAYLGAAKPKLKEGYRRAKSEAAVRAWAEHAKEGVDLLAKLFSLDEKGRDKYMAEVRARKMYSEEEVRERQRQLEQWNPGKKFNGTCYPLNPVDVMARVMERLGYEAGAKVALPVVAAAPDSGFGYYVLTTRNGKTYYPGRWLTTIDDVVDEIVYAAKVENADPDTDHPAGKFSVKGVGEVLTEHTGKWTVITQRSLSARVEQHTFGSKEEAEAFAEKYKAGGKNRYASAPEEEVRAAGYTQYEIVYRHDSPTKGTGVYMPTGKMYGSLEEARAAIDGEHDELNGIVNAKLAEEKGKGGEGRKKDYVKIVLYTEDGRTWKYGVVLDDKYAPKKTSTDSMPFYLGDGFGTRKEAQAFVDKHREEWDAKIADIEKARRDFVYFKGTGERTGQDWRKGADVSAEQLMEQFGFRGVQFGNWTNQRDRQAAVNGAFDALMDLAQILGVSPRALSLNGELGLAFGSRGGGSAKAHYEPDEVVINLTKTQGAGSLAHEWWHALDNYFARHGNVKGGMVTESKGIAMRDELREAFNALIDSVAGSDYNIRSRQRGASYWGRPAEETARLFAAWVSDELQKRGLSSPFLSDTDPGAAERYAEMMYRLYKAMYESRKAETGGKAMTFEEFKKTPLALSGFVFPGTEELAAFGGHLRNIFNTVQEKVDGQTGKTLLYHRGPVVAEPNEAEQALLEAVNGVLKDTGIEVVTDTDEGQKVLDAANGNDVKLEASHRSGEAEERNKMWRLIDRATAMFTGKTEKEAREARRKEMQKITAERKEMYDRVLSGNFDEVTLRQIDNYIDNFSPYNNEWRPISKRLPQKALRGLRKGERASAVDVLFSRISESAVPKNERAGAEGKRRIEEKKKELLKKWAIATGNWHTSVSDFTDAKEPLGSGKDSDVYQSKDGKHVIKVSKGKDGLKKFRPDIDAVTLFNYIFPESRYEILGYGEVDGKFVKFLKQPVVDFTGSKPLSAEERVAYMADMGFKPVNKEKTAFSNGTIVVADLQGNNIVRDKSGNIRVIDADVKLHTKDFGGQYSYPPVEADTALPQANNGGNEKPRMQKVYHGSGADFDEFDNSHMGEGEGAQAYGWGTYVTEVEGIGRTYAKATARYDDNSSEEVLNRVESLAADLIKDRFGFRPGLSVSARGDNYDLEIPSDKKTLEQIKSYFDEYPYMWNAKVDRELSSFNLDDAASRREFANWVYEIVEPFAADAVGYAQKEETASRHLYTVEIPDDNGENYIDYNGRISDIPSQKIDAICTELEKLGWKRKDLPSMVRLTDGYGNIVLNPNAAGADLYEEIKVALKSQKLASELLSRAGFAGIKYPAEYMSGGRKDGAKNYVIFNEKDARITDHVRFFRTSGGEAYGFTVGGKIYVDPRIATADTPIHEYAHLWGDMMRRVNPKAWGDIVRLMKGKGGLWDWVKKNYPELETDDEVADEVLAQFSGKRGAERLREEMGKAAEGSGSITEKAKAISALQRVKEALGRFWRGVAELLHIRFTTAEEVADRVMADMLHGVDPRKVMDGGKSLRPEARINIVGASPEQGFKSYAEAKEWAKQNIARTYSSEETGGKGTIRISNAAIGKYLSQSAVDKSDSKDVHLAVLKVLPEVLRESVDAEQHADHLKGEDGVRSADSGINPDVTIHRLYGAVTIGGKLYRVKVTLKEDLQNRGLAKKAYSYEATKIELLAGTLGKPEDDAPNTSNSITAANLLRGVEKSYGGGKFFEDYWNPRYSLRHPFGEDRKEERKSEESGSVEEVNRKFNEQLQQQIDGKLPDGHTYQMGMPGKILRSTGIPKLPIELSAKRLHDKATMFDHDFELSDVKDLVKAMQHPLAVFAYGDKAKAQNIVVSLEKDGKNFIVGLSITPTVKGRKLEINSIRNVFPKDNAEWLNWISQDKALYIDKEKIQTLIDQQRTNLADVDYLDLDNTANIVQGFENPKLPEENVSDEGKKFRLLDDDDPQAQELSLPEGEPKETLAQAMVRRVKELAAKLGAKVRIVTSADDLPKTPGSRQRRMKGMYDTRTGEVTIVIGNHENLADVENTVLHEAVGHRGFRVLFDTKEKFDHAMDELYRVSGGKIRKWIDDKVRKLYDDEVDRIMERKRKERRARGEGPSEHHLEDMAAAAIEASKKKDQFRREATEEYGARLAGRIGEKGFEKLSAEEQTFWGRLKAMLQKALQRLAEGLNITGRHEWTDKDWAYVLHEAYKREKNGGKPSIFDEADTIAMRMRTGFGEGKEEGRKMTTLSGEEAKQALNEIFSAESHTVKPEKISSLAKFRDIFSKPIRTFLGEVIKVKDAVWNKVLRENRQNISGAILPTLQNADFAIRDTDGSILYVKRFLNSTGESTYNVAVVNKHGELEDYISSVHIKTNNNLLNKIGKGAELLIPENRNGYGHEVPSSSTPDAKIDIENESGNTFGSNKYKKSSDENPDEGMMFRDGDDDDIGDVDLGDAVDKMRDAAVESNANNLQAKREAMKAIGGNLSKLRQAMSRQKVYDKGTVKSVTDMAREMLQNGMLDKLSGYEAKRILSAAANVTGAENTARQINKLMDVMVDNQLRNAGDTFGKLLHSKGTRVNASGVEVQGKLDPDGAAIVDALKKGVQLDKEELNGRIGKALDKIGSEDKVIADQAANELAGLQLASRYVEDIKGSKAEETELRESLKEAKAQKDAGKMSAEAYKQYCEATEDAIRQNKIERADAYRQLIAQLGGVMGESAERAKAWREAEKQRVQDIQHNANSDMQGRPCNEHHKPSSLQKLCNSDLIRGLLMPLATFEQMLRMFGNKNVHGEGYLWNRFVRGWLRASENEYSGYRDALKELDDKVSEIFGKKMRWGDIFSLERKLPTMEVKFWDGGEMKPHTLTQGNLAYIYMVDKMSDGRMKLRAMGITEGDVEQIAKALDPKLKKLADWMQDEFLVQRRNKYNEVHKRMFGASMAAIENYFPLKILSGARTENVDVADDTGEPTMTSTTTGSIVKRRRNNLALDITNADAFSVILEHLQDMEHWAAYSEFNRDLNTLLSYRRFKNQVMNMSSAYGAGATLWKNFRNVCQLAAGSYRPPVATLDKTMVNLAKGVTAAKISFRIFTAIKQLLSFPAYLPDASARYLLQNLANPVGAWKWSIENLPLFHKRWNSRMAGDPRLLKTEMDWKMWRSRVVQMASKYGMSPNAFVDAVTVAMGAHAIYKTKLAKYLKQGYDKDKAEEKARQDAEIAYNQTQQSSEGAFLSTMQADRTWGSVLFTVFRNSAMSYTRQEYDALRNLARKLTTKGYKEKSIGFMAKQMVRDGLDENTAWRNAKRTYSRSIWREFVRVATFGYILQLAWNLGAYLPYLLLGDNDDDKKKMLEDAGLHALVGSVEGLTGGDVLSTAGQYALTGEGTIGNLKKEMPLTSDLHAIYQSFDYDAVQATNDVLNLLVQAGVGVNPQSLTDAVVGVMDYCENNPADARECALLIARIFNTPQSQLDKIYFDEIDLDGSDARKLSPKQIAERYAKYKLRRNTPLTAWMYGEDGRKERVAKYKKAANDVAKERLSALTDSRSGEDFTDWRNEYKQTSEGWGRINGLKDTDPDQYAAERKQIAGTPADTRYRIENRYKARINKLTDAWLKAKTPARRMKLADAMVALKKDEAKHLAAGK